MTALYVMSPETAIGETALCAAIGKKFLDEGKRVGFLKSLQIPLVTSKKTDSKIIDPDVDFMKRVLNLEEVNGMAEWKELWDQWPKIHGEIDEMREKGILTSVEEGYLKGFALSIESAMRALEDLEVKIEKKGVQSSDPVLRDAFKRSLDAFYSVAKNGLTKIGIRASELQDRVWHFGIIAVTSFLERKAGSVGVESWSIVVNTGFPAGVSTTATVNFRKE